MTLGNAFLIHLPLEQTNAAGELNIVVEFVEEVRTRS